MAKLKVGDIVQLKAGGPKMTVIETGRAPHHRPGFTVECSWFAGSKNERGSFPPDALALVADEETGKK